MFQIMLRRMHLRVKCIQFYEKMMKIMISLYLKCKIKSLTWIIRIPLCSTLMSIGSFQPYYYNSSEYNFSFFFLRQSSGTLTKLLMQMTGCKAPTSELKSFILSCGHVGMGRKYKEIEGQFFFCLIMLFIYVVIAVLKSQYILI